MKKEKKIYDTSDELIVQRYENGVQLVRPEKFNRHPIIGNTLIDIFNLPMNFYFIDIDSKIKNLNENTAATCGYGSQKDAVKKSVQSVATRKTAELILKNDQAVIKTNNSIILEESFTRKTGVDLLSLTLKFPWLHDGNVIGVFGCSILLDPFNTTILADSLSMLIQTGLLPHSSFLVNNVNIA